MKRFSLLAGAALFAVMSVTLVAAEVNLEGVKCIMNPKADAKAEKSVDYKGGKVFFCCGNCPKAFAKKIEGKDKVVMAKANHQLVATGQAEQSKCPFTGGPLKTELTVDGAKIQFCCNKCKGKAESLEGDEKMVVLFGEDAWDKAEFEVEEAK